MLYDDTFCCFLVYTEHFAFFFLFLSVADKTNQFNITKNESLFVYIYSIEYSSKGEKKKLILSQCHPIIGSPALMNINLLI